MSPEPPPLRLTPARTTEERPAKASGTKSVMCGFRTTTAWKSAALDLCERHRGLYPSDSDFYEAGMKNLIEHHAETDDRLKPTVTTLRAEDEYERMKDAMVAGIERTKTLVQDAVTRSMAERAHVLYAARKDRILECADADWRTEGLRILEASVRPLLPRRNALNLRILQRNTEK